jgi:phytoene dehydrogenase-like protein
MSPCAYLCGLLHPRVIEELDLPRRGFHWSPATNGLFVPFEDGSSVQIYDDDDLCDAEIRNISPRDVPGWRALRDVLRRLRDAIRPADDHDVWLGEPPAREQIEARLDNDSEAKHVLFDWSMAEFVEHYLEDERLQIAYLGQGVIGTNASPFDPGTAYIRFHHACGRQGGLPGAWGYVTGGMGMISFFLADAAREAGATIATGVPVAQIVPGEGVLLEAGDRIHAPIVISNADPRRTLKLLAGAVDPGWRTKVQSIPQLGCTLKVNVWMRELPNFRARPGTFETHHLAQINTPLNKQEWKAGYQAARNERLPERLWTELYFQTAHDQSVAPAGTHTMSVFAQYVPYHVDNDAAKARALDSIARFCTNMPDAVIQAEALGPADIERRVGLTGGHIFQGECLPPYLWSNRLSARTPMPGVYLCGACTHPGGSVIAVNGRNAAMAVLADMAGGSASSASGSVRTQESGRESLQSAAISD